MNNSQNPRYDGGIIVKNETILQSDGSDNDKSRVK